MKTYTKVLVNKAQCRLCLDVIESKHVHDYWHCQCGEIMVDGGMDYLRRGWKHRENFIDLSETVEEPVKVCSCEIPKTYSKDGIGYCFTCLGWRE